MLGVQVDLSRLQPGGLYYFRAEKSAKKIHEYNNSPKRKHDFVKVQGNASLLSTTSEGNGDSESHFHTYLVFIVNRIALRRLDQRSKVGCCLLMMVSNLVVICLKKAEKGINLEDFDFLQQLIEFGQIEEDYDGREKFRNYLAAVMLVYFSYHKELRAEEMDDYLNKKLDSRKVNKPEKFNSLKTFLRYKIPYFGFQSFMRCNYASTMK